MVDWDSKVRGTRVGDGSPARGLVFGCTICQRHKGRTWTELAPLGIAHLYARDIARRLRCTNCGERKGYVMIWADANHA